MDVERRLRRMGVSTIEEGLERGHRALIALQRISMAYQMRGQKDHTGRVITDSVFIQEVADAIEAFHR